MLFLSLLCFWLTYGIVSWLMYDRSHVKFLTDKYISPKTDYCILTVNCLLSFLLLPIFYFVPTIIYFNDTWYGYVFRWLIAFFISDVWLYKTHTMFHTPSYYRYHKLHHQYIEPHPIAGLVSHPIEFIISNYFSMMIPLTIISNQNLMPLEMAFVAFDILMSHKGSNCNYFSAKYHTLHHIKNNCNYGFLYFSDL